MYVHITLYICGKITLKNVNSDSSVPSHMIRNTGGIYTFKYVATQHRMNEQLSYRENLSNREGLPVQSSTSILANLDCVFAFVLDILYTLCALYSDVCTTALVAVYRPIACTQ